MKDLRILINSLESFSPKIIALNASNPYTSVSFIYIVKNDTIFSQGSIYVGYASQFDGMINSIHEATLFIIRDVDNLMLPLEHQNNIVLFPADTDIKLLEAVTFDLLSGNQALINESYKLFNIFLDNSNIEDILTECSNMVGYPLLVMDVSFNLIAHSKNPATTDFFWTKIITTGCCVYEDISKINKLMQNSYSISTHKPYYSDVEGSNLKRLVSKIISGTHWIGFLIALENGEDENFLNLNRDLYMMMSDLFAKLIVQEHNILDSHLVTSTDIIFIECLEGKLQDKTLFYKRLKLTDLDLNSSYRILIVDIYTYIGTDNANNYLRDYLSSIFPRSWILTYKGNVIVLADIRKVKNIDRLLENNRSFFVKNRLRIAQSDTFTDLFDIRSNYRKALNSLKFSSRLKDNSVIIKFDDYKIYDILASSVNRENLQAYMSEFFKEVKKYDIETESEYCDTIYQYIICNKKLDEIAKNLNIHKNTVSYRIRKVREVFDLDLNDVNEQYKFYYSYLIDQMKRAGLLD